LRRFLLVWLILLAVSHLVWALRAPPPTPPGLESLDARAVAERGAEIRLLARTTPLAFAHRGGDAAADAGATPTVFLHGSPGSHADFLATLAHWTAPGELLLPDLPGFGASRGRGARAVSLPSYSIRAHAAYVLQLLDARGIGRAHVVGFSMGGGVALEIARQAPARVASLALISSIGVQEMELLGSYEMNHLVHLLQLGALRFAEWGLPHFGALDGALLDAAYARNFADSDQRPLRGVLQGLTVPVLIVHGAKDFLVPQAAAREHARLVPQAELRVLPSAGHFLPWTQEAALAEALQDFHTRVADGRAPDAARAEVGRVVAAAWPFDPATIPPLAGVALLIVLLLLAAATLVSEDLTCIGAGVLVSQGRIGLLAASGACFAGIFAGDVLLYLAGRTLGARALVRAPLRWFVTEGGAARAREDFRRRGLALIFLSRLTPGLRLPTYFVAGMLKTGFVRFAAYFVVAGAVWTPILVFSSSVVGREASVMVKQFGAWAPLAAVALILTMYLLLRVGLPALTWRGRRLLLGAWRRKRRWEYWPRWAFYPPIVLFGVLRGALRHRSLAVVTAANPGMATGGLVGESKSAILKALGPHPEIARHVALPPGDADARVAAAQAAGLGWPLVIKPDVGERGRDVQFARDAAEARAIVAPRPWPLIAQEYVGGVEYGVFYSREPGAARGRVTSITLKELPEVIGDGSAMLERLILSHPRHVNMGKYFLEVNAARLGLVPAAGECVVLSPLGTHARGATFRDANRLLTRELEEAIERVSRRCAGFHLGRYDLRAPSEADFRAGRNLKVLELNGIASEPTHIYDPAAPLLPAWRALIAQWRLAYDMGAANAAAGARPALLRECLRAWRAARAAGPR
jgi:pimeloyl-ACP methyl ester carboxylesterase/membrane protein DedA with SNARE-associated domain